ncbi:Imm50 family immunity protein, partial [Pasteurellaceae bacterium LIM206]|nr:Imm50 family immunity protein [Pasteurellaceae bacterium LIM206]
MRWFEKVVGKEKIIHMFDGGLELNNVYLNTVVCYDYKLDVVFYLLDIPSKIPERWLRTPFNAIKINLEFFNLNEITFYSKGIHMVNGELELGFSENKVEFSFINKNDVTLSGSSDVVRIADI